MLSDYFSLKTLPALAFPSLGIAIGGTIGRFITPSLKTLVILRNISAGLVLAAISTELAPEISDAQGYVNRLSVLAGMILGLGVMILIRTIFSQEQEEQMSLEVVLSIALDFFIDSVLIGIALKSLIKATGKTAYILAVSLGIEMFILSMTTVSQMHLANSNLLYIIGTLSLFIFASISGMGVGALLSEKLKGGPAFYAMIAFGVSALVWLVLEDLFTKSKYLDTRIGAVMLFIGYMSVIIMGWFS